jgi:hypothetical protein
MQTRPRIGLVFALAAAIGCGSVTASPDASSGGTSGGGAGRGGSSAAGTTGTGGGTAGAPGGSSGTAGRGGAGGALTGTAGRGGAGGSDGGGGRGGASGTAGRGGSDGGTAGTSGTAGRGGTGGGLAGTSGAAGRGGAGGGLAGTSGTAGRGGAGGGLAGTSGTAGRGGAGGGLAGAGGNRVPCQTDAECQLFKCCNGVCVNETNDIQNCGGCGKVCTGLHPYCDQGNCGTPPCSGIACVGTEVCCGSQCCTTGQLCCFREVGPGTLVCSDPVLGTCPQGCMSGCPCTAPNTPIATPAGDRPISELRAGDLVYSVHHGAFAVVPIKLVHRTAVAPTHEVVETRLAHGVVLRITPAHPTADGRTFGDLRRGDRLDGVGVESARVVPYGGDFTYDILPDSDTGTYVAGGVLIGSALAGPVNGHVASVDPVQSARRASLAPTAARHPVTP